MSTGVERQQKCRTPIDHWSTREKLCLISAVSTNSDEQPNWNTISRNLKLMCSNINPQRPSDWFSPKNCASQYDYLVDALDAPKRKTRPSDASGCGGAVVSPTSNDPPIETLLKNLTEEHVHELEADIRKDRDEYLKIQAEIEAIQSSQMNEDRLLQIWREIEKQQDADRIEEMKYENKMRERDQRKQELLRNWRSSGAAAVGSVVVGQSMADTTTVDMDLEEIIGTGKTIIPAANQQSGTSPLLSSLLKSPTATTAPPIAANNNAHSARTSAPTITTLLTSGLIPKSNQPTIILKNTIPPEEAAQLLARPISGPPGDVSSSSSSSGQSISPSQSAPTLSMLLEKTKTAVNQEVAPPIADSGATKAGTFVADLRKNVETPVTDSNNEEVPMDIEESDNNPKASGSTTTETEAFDGDKPEPNEEEQLLEVFENIGNIEIDIDRFDIDVNAVIDDEEVDFLKGVDEEPAAAAAENLEGGDQAEVLISEEVVEDTKTDEKDHEKEKEVRSADKVVEEDKQTKVETNSSSDESNDNIPLAAVATLENKDRTHIEEVPLVKEESETSRDKEEVCEEVNNETVNDDEAGETVEGKAERADETLAVEDDQDNLIVSLKSPQGSDNSDVIIIPTDDDDSNAEKTESVGEKKESSIEITEDLNEPAGKKQENVANDKIESDDSHAVKKSPDTDLHLAQAQDESENESKPTIAPPVPTISIADTDEDSSTTDVSTTTRRDDKITSPSKFSTGSQHPQQRKSFNEPKTDDDSSAPSFTAAPTRVRRKLRDRSESPMISDEKTARRKLRDRSESPMIQDEATTNSRRYSTPVIDSFPSSPAAGTDATDVRTSKKILLKIYSTLLNNKNIGALHRIFADDHKTKYQHLCKRPMDLHTIRKNIESGAIRSTIDLQRDVLLMCQNALMVSRTGTSNYEAVVALMKDPELLRNFITSSHAVDGADAKPEKDTKEIKLNTSMSNPKPRGGRKSAR